MTVDSRNLEISLNMTPDSLDIGSASHRILEKKGKKIRKKFERKIRDKKKGEKIFP